MYVVCSVTPDLLPYSMLLPHVAPLLLLRYPQLLVLAPDVCLFFFCFNLCHYCAHSGLFTTNPFYNETALLAYVNGSARSLVDPFFCFGVFLCLAPGWLCARKTSMRIFLIQLVVLKWAIAISYYLHVILSHTHRGVDGDSLLVEVVHYSGAIVGYAVVPLYFLPLSSTDSVGTVPSACE